MFPARLTAIALCPLIWAVPAAAGSIIVGVEWTADPRSGPLYQINPATGATTPLGVSAYPYWLTGGPQVNQVIMTSPVNPYTLDIHTGQVIDMGSYIDPASLPAYDTDRRAMWAVGTAYGNPEVLLWSFPADPCQYCIRHGTPVGPLGFNPTSSFRFVMDYAPGFGLYGIYQSTLFSINRDTGHATLVAPIVDPTHGLPLSIQDFAYDEYSRKLIVVTGPGYFLFGGPLGPRGIYSVDLNDGLATLLSDQGPNITGIARVEIPEPGTLVLAAFGLLFAWQNRRNMPSRL